MVVYFQTYIANLLGVAGTDIPIKEIQKFLSPFQVCLVEVFHYNDGILIVVFSIYLVRGQWLRFLSNE